MQKQSSEGILTLPHWLGVVDARPLALFRILLGITLLQDLCFRAGGIGTFMTDDGVAPLGTRAAGTEPSLFHLTSTTAGSAWVFGLGVLVTLAFTLGFYARIASALAFVFFVSLHRRVVPIQTGGDALADALLFFGSFVDLSGRFSVDARRLGPRAEVRALVFRIMQYLPGLMYLYTARQKLLEGGRAWFGGPIIYQHMQLDGWVRPPGHWLGEHPGLCAFFTFATIVTEFLIPVLLVVPFAIRPARALAILCNLGLQMGILLTLKVGVFTYVMFAVSALWILPEWLDRVGGVLARIPAVREAPQWSPGRRVVAATLVVVFFFVSAVPVLGRHLPSFVHRSLRFAGLSITTGMFTHGTDSKRWEATGDLTDARATKPLLVVAPGAFDDGFVNNQWMQLPYHLDEFAALGRYVCRRYNAARPGAKLRAWTLTEVSRSPHLPHEGRATEVRKTLWSQECNDEGGAIAHIGPR